MAQLRGTAVESSVPAQDSIADEDLYAPAADENDLAVSDVSTAPAADDGPYPEPVEPPAIEPQRPGMSDAEKQAYAKGWRPLAQYRGAPGTWVDAETFLRRGEETLAFVRRDLRQANEKLERSATETRELRGLIEGQAKVIQRLEEQNRRSEQAGYERAIRELRAKQRDAASSGDLVTYDQIGEQISEVEERKAAASAPVPEVPPPPPAPQPTPEMQPNVVPPEIEEFLEANSWYGRDMVLQNAMRAAHLELIESAPALSLAENLKRAKERVMAQYPGKFGIDPRRPRPRSSVSEPTAPAPRGTARATGIAAVQDPAERAQLREAFVRARGQMPDLTEDEFMAVYENPKADVLDVQDRARTRRSPNGR